jgi:hypothetical protein
VPPARPTGDALREFLAGIADHQISRIDEILTGRLNILTAVGTGHTEKM